MNKSDHRIKGLGEASIRVKDLPAMQKFYEEVVGLKVEATTHEWLQVRPLYFPDPEGNLLELVAYDANVRDAE